MPDRTTGLTAVQMIRLSGLHDAIRAKDRQAVATALERDGAFLVDTEINGKNALLVAAREGDAEVLARIAPLSSDLNRLAGLEGTRWTPLQCAAAHRQLEAVGVLLRLGADPRVRQPAWSAAGTTSPGGKQALHHAAEVNSRRIARLLLQHGAEVDARDDAGETPLIRAACHRYGRKLVELLLDSGADPASRDKQGRTPLDWARQRRNDRVALLLEGKS